MAIIRKIFVFGRFEPHQRQLARPALIFAVFTVTGESSVRAGHSVVLAIFLAAILMQSSFGAEDSRLVGTWRLLSYVAEVQATGEKLPVMGDKPTGFVTFLPGGRVFFMLTGEGRKPQNRSREGGAVRHAGRLYGYLQRRRRYLDDQCRCSLESGVGWHQTGPLFQTGGGPARHIDPMADHAELVRQGHDTQHCQLRTR